MKHEKIIIRNNEIARSLLPGAIKILEEWGWNVGADNCKKLLDQEIKKHGKLFYEIRNNKS